MSLSSAQPPPVTARARVRRHRAPRGIAVRASSSSSSSTDGADLSRRDLLSSAAMAAAMAAAMPLDRAAGPFAVPAAFAAADPTLLLPTIPRAPAPLKFSAQTPSTIIKGCWQLSGGHRGDPASDRTSGAAAVDDFASFVAAGIDTFDTGPEACGYGPSELVIGEALKRETLRRDDVKIFTKLCCVGREQGNMTKDWVTQKLDLPMRRLGVKSLDLVQMYWNDYGQKGYVDAALFLTDAKAAGKIGAVGLTNFDTERMAQMVDAGAEISSNQIQFSLLDRRPRLKMIGYCEKTGISLLPYGVVAGGLLSDNFLGVDGSDVALDTSSKRKYASVVGYAGGYKWFQTLLETLRSVGDKHGGQSVANVASRWVLDSNDVTPAIILGARNAAHVDDHRRMFTFELDAEDKAKIEAVLARGKAPSADCYAWERGGPW